MNLVVDRSYLIFPEDLNRDKAIAQAESEHSDNALEWIN